MPKNGPNPTKANTNSRNIQRRQISLRYEAAGCETLEEYAKALGATITTERPGESVE